VLPDTQFKLNSRAANFSFTRELDALADGTLAADALRLKVKTSDGSFDIGMPPLVMRHVGIGEMDAIYESVTALRDRLDRELLRTESGDYVLTYKGPLFSGHGDRFQCTHVNFETPFNIEPKVVLGFRLFDSSSERNLRLQAFFRNITQTGFELCASTWWDSIAYYGALTWIAYGN